ncbi:MAG: response regulator transcription factor [Actinomycetes bacterium]|jgi:Response regulator containing a CheY-like receiver domain and an HTH DNA-binding domain|nr:response regulator transcription factor [Acidimicrobiia bacterium]
MATKVLLVDDHEVVRRGLAAMLSVHEDIEVVGEAASADEAVKRVGLDQPDVVVMDVRMPDKSGIEACREILANFPDVRVLMLTSYADEEALMASIMAGASGYVLKRVKGADLIEDIRRVARGESLLDPDMVERLFERLRHGTREDPKLAQLTEQERKILDLIADGLTNRQIAEKMFLAEKTVKNYVSTILAKMGMSNRSEAAAYVARLEAGQNIDPEEW